MPREVFPATVRSPLQHCYSRTSRSGFIILMGASPSISGLRLFAPSPHGSLCSVLLCATRIMLQGYSCRPPPLQMFTTFGVTFLASATTKSDILIALSRVAVCRVGGATASTSKGLSQYKPFFALSLGFILLHQKKNHKKRFFSCPMQESNLQTIYGARA